jgi:adenosyl cobinamide kinase/adenosyl cobinamide phosphate guanylyltransferase
MHCHSLISETGTPNYQSAFTQFGDSNMTLHIGIHSVRRRQQHTTHRHSFSSETATSHYISAFTQFGDSNMTLHIGTHSVRRQQHHTTYQHSPSSETAEVSGNTSRSHNTASTRSCDWSQQSVSGLILQLPTQYFQAISDRNVLVFIQLEVYLLCFRFLSTGLFS